MEKALTGHLFAYQKTMVLEGVTGRYGWTLSILSGGLVSIVEIFFFNRTCVISTVHVPQENTAWLTANIMKPY